MVGEDLMWGRGSGAFRDRKGPGGGGHGPRAPELAGSWWRAGTGSLGGAVCSREVRHQLRARQRAGGAAGSLEVSISIAGEGMAGDGQQDLEGLMSQFSFV